MIICDEFHMLREHTPEYILSNKIFDEFIDIFKFINEMNKLYSKYDFNSFQLDNYSFINVDRFKKIIIEIITYNRYHKKRFDEGLYNTGKYSNLINLNVSPLDNLYNLCIATYLDNLSFKKLKIDGKQIDFTKENGQLISTYLFNLINDDFRDEIISFKKNINDRCDINDVLKIFENSSLYKLILELLYLANEIKTQPKNDFGKEFAKTWQELDIKRNKEKVKYLYHQDLSFKRVKSQISGKVNKKIIGIIRYLFNEIFNRQLYSPLILIPEKYEICELSSICDKEGKYNHFSIREFIKLTDIK